MAIGFRSPLWLLGIAAPGETDVHELVGVFSPRAGAFGTSLASPAISGNHGVELSFAPSAGHSGTRAGMAVAPIGHGGVQRSASPVAGTRGSVHV